MRHLRHVALTALALSGTLATACSSLHLHPQLDWVARTITGSGAQTTAAEHFAHAKYTLFAWADPPDCLQGLALLDASGRVRTGGPSGALILPQIDVAGGDYRLRTFTTVPRCAWMVEEVLNRMQSDDTPPWPEPAPRAPAVAAPVSSAATPVDVPVSGLYSVTVSVTTVAGASCAYNLRFTNPAGDSEPLGSDPGGVAGGATMSTTMEMFLTAGTRTVVGAPSHCPWQVSVLPEIGPTGGGARGFAPSAG